MKALSNLIQFGILVALIGIFYLLYQNKHLQSETKKTQEQAYNTKNNEEHNSSRVTYSDTTHPNNKNKDTVDNNMNLKHQNKSSSKHKATNENPAPNQIYENQALASIDDTLEQPILTRSFIIPEQCGYGNYLETFVDENISFYNPENFQIKYQKTGFYELSGKYISETLPKDSESDKIYLSQNNIYFIRENYWASYFSAQDNTPCEYTIGLLADIPSKRQNDYDYFIVNTKVTLDPNYSYIKTELIERKVIKPIVLPSGKIFVLYSNEQEKVYQSDGKENIKLLHGELYIEQGTNYQSITIK